MELQPDCEELRARVPVCTTLQALSLVEKAEPVQVRYFTLRSRDQRRMDVLRNLEILQNWLTQEITWEMKMSYISHWNL